ncbi:cytochrome c biogenesis heme-transporting ATPase CcmA [Lacimicrobium alkaliphilum]|uniref:Cytochrome c biogenesis ATP-binding export protein CcmA n=1 Tax=Lacimicrobium alkaliphilum TaxID=1526571 RepID=A0ABQ1RMP7_9ALTE|nr:cytochrome c biogenesis heme-transporting ATPase CcmA [Lacimicrobium alkaliphilum]GGD72651.1 cytochrome c biogenesis ATP-binding export protein CcmA [Lacimicrobium alkaliphilum]
MSCLSVNNLCCIKRDRVLFERLSFTVETGDIMHIQGPNGAGKTSLLRILVGLAEPDSGEVLWQQQNIRQVMQGYSSQLVYCGHKYAVNQSLTAAENLLYWCRMQNVSANTDVYPVLDEIGLVGLEHLPAGQLSAGQQRRIALARLWLKPARLWVLDEPFTALDSYAIDLLSRKMEQHLAGQGMLLLTSHQSLALDHPVRTLELEYRL